MVVTRSSYESSQHRGAAAQRRHHAPVRSPRAGRPTLVPTPAGRGSERDDQPGATSPVRLTHRGRAFVLVAVVVALLVAFSIGRVMSSASSGAHRPATHTVVVAPGDTAWSLARAAMPGIDGRLAVDRLVAMNHLGSTGGAVRVGQTLVVPGP